MGLENPQAKRLGCMIMAASTRIDQLWSKCTPAMLLGWLSKLQVNVMDKIDVLKTVGGCAVWKMFGVARSSCRLMLQGLKSVNGVLEWGQQGWRGGLRAGVFPDEMLWAICMALAPYRGTALMLPRHSMQHVTCPRF